MSFTRDTVGLVFFDDFNRSNRNLDGDNGWEEESAGVYDIVGNIVEGRGGSGGHEMGQPLGDQDEIIVQFNSESQSQQTRGHIFCLAPTVDIGGSGAYWVNVKGGNGYRIAIAGGGVIGSGGTAPGNGTPATLRLVVDKSVSPVELRCYAVKGITNLQDLSNDLTLQASATDAGTPPSGSYFGIYDGDGSNTVDTDFDEFFVCGRNIAVTGLPSGWKVQVDSRAAVVESGGSVEIDVDAWALPATTIKILDDSDVEQDSLTPSGGIWGGDEYSFVVPVGPDTPTLTVDDVGETDVDVSGSAYNHADGDPHAASQWQVDLQAGDFSTPVFDSGDDTTNLTSRNISGLSVGTGYKARVRYKDDDGIYSDWSNAVNFTTSEAPNQPTITVDDFDNSTADLSGSAFSDPDAGTHAASQWQVAEEGTSFASPDFDSGVDASNLTSITATGLLGGVDYEARVRYQDDDGIWSAWSTAATFTTLTWGECVDPPATSWGSCEEAPTGSVSSFSRTREGLIFEDDFNRPDDPDVGNGWSEVLEPSLVQLESSRIDFTSPTTAAIGRDLGVERDGLLAQVHSSAQADSHGLVLRLKWESSVLDDDWYLFAENDEGFADPTNWRITKREAGTTTVLITDDSDGSAPSIPQGQAFAFRAVIIDDTLKLLYSNNPVHLDDDTGEFTLVLETTDDPPPADLGTWVLFGGRNEHSDNYFVCGSQIVVSGLPEGWKVQVDSRTAVEESGGEVSFDVSTWELPATSIKLLDEDDNVIETLTPSGGIYGGDIYEAVGGSSFSGCVEAPATSWSNC